MVRIPEDMFNVIGLKAEKENGRWVYPVGDKYKFQWRSGAYFDMDMYPDYIIFRNYYV
jgi:hypothetical protein